MKRQDAYLDHLITIGKPDTRSGLINAPALVSGRFTTQPFPVIGSIWKESQDSGSYSQLAELPAREFFKQGQIFKEHKQGFLDVGLSLLKGSTQYK